mmetsp:Transcript_490/g.1062  ORF Transcript_490/g.1062 Transcript_490/m.1062 type:complete len:122 (-) Transcript_490:1085-1450(-)
MVVLASGLDKSPTSLAFERRTSCPVLLFSSLDGLARRIVFFSGGGGGGGGEETSCCGSFVGAKGARLKKNETVFSTLLLPPLVLRVEQHTSTTRHNLIDNNIDTLHYITLQLVTFIKTATT